MSCVRVAPTHERRGLAKMMLEWGLKEADRQGRRVVLVSSPFGRALYERHGFVPVLDINMDMRKYGEDREYREFAMVRDAKR